MKTRPRDARGRFIKAATTLPQSEKPVDVHQNSVAAQSKNNEHDTLHQTLRQVNRIAERGGEPSVKESLKVERFMEKTIHWLFVVFVVCILWLLFAS